MLFSLHRLPHCLNLSFQLLQLKSLLLYQAL